MTNLANHGQSPKRCHKRCAYKPYISKNEKKPRSTLRRKYTYTTRDPVYTHTASWPYEYELSCRYDTPRTCTVDDIDKHRFEDDDSGQYQSVTIFHSCTKTLYVHNMRFFLVPTAGLQPLFASIICIYELRFHGSYTCNESVVRFQDVFWRNVFEEVGVL